MKISEQRTYVGEDGAMIHAHCPYWVDSGEPAKIVFFAMANHFPTIGGRTLQDQFRVDIPAETVEQAFELLPSLLKDAQAKRIETLKEQIEAERRRIQISGLARPMRFNGHSR